MSEEIQAALTELERCIETTVLELQLVEQIDSGLAQLRIAYRNSRGDFETADIIRLWFAGHIRDLAQEFMQLRQELSEVGDPRQYSGLQCALVALEEGLRDTALVARVRKELVDIEAQSPSHRAGRGQLDKARAAARDREKRVRMEPCPQGHRMVLRQSKNGSFYGCSRYPACRATRNIDSEGQ